MSEAVGQGTVLARRYRLVRAEPGGIPGSARWSAVDTILDRAVHVVLVSGPEAVGALDAARRAALVTDPRLARVVDVGRLDDLGDGDAEADAETGTEAGSGPARPTGYVVTEHVEGPSLADLAAAGPLSAEQARALVGEVATALEVARRRGVHHLALRPSVVRLTPDGRVLLTGLALDAALLGRPDPDARRTSRADALDLVRLLYAALTGSWPADPRRPDVADAGALPPAPLADGHPVPPADLVTGVPNDLDTLCAVTLGPHDDGPQTPADLVGDLEPWGGIRAGTAPAGSPWGQVRPGSPGATPDGTQHDDEHHDEHDDRAEGQDGDDRTDDEGGPAVTTEGPEDGTAPPEDAAAAEDAAATGDAAASPTTGPVQRTSVRVALGRQRSPVRPGTPPPAFPPRRTEGAAAGSAAASAAAGAGSSSTLPDPFGAAARATTPARGVEGVSTHTGSVALSPSVIDVGPGSVDAAVPPVGTVPRRVPLAARGVAGPSVPVPAVRTPARGTPAPGAPAPAGPVAAAPAPVVASAAAAPDLDWDVIGQDPDDDEPRPRRLDTGLVVLLLVVVLVVAGVAVAARQLFAAPGGEADPGTSAAASTAPATDAAPSDAAAAPAPAPVAPQIAGITSIDPSEPGAGEHEELVGQAVDGDPATTWITRRYSRADFGGLKDAVGLVVTLAQPATVTTVTLTTTVTGGAVELRATDAANPTAGDVLASGALAPSTVLTLSAPTSTASFVLWFTDLPPAPDGDGFRIEIGEVAVS